MPVAQWRNSGVSGHLSCITMRRRTISAWNSAAPLSFILGADLDFVMLGAELDFVRFVNPVAAGVRVWSGPGGDDRPCSFCDRLGLGTSVEDAREGSGSRGTVADRENERCWSGFAGVFSAAALAGLLCDPPFLAYRGGVTGCPWRVRAGTTSESDWDRARCEVALASAIVTAMDGSERDMAGQG